MSKFKHVKLEEEVKIDVENKNSSIQSGIVNIILRNPKNEDIKYNLNTKEILNANDLVKEVTQL